MRAEIINDLAVCVLQYQAQVKMFHWQTTSYSMHVALNTLYEYLIKANDKLVEAAMGVYGRPSVQGRHLLLEDTTSARTVGSFLQAKVTEFTAFRSKLSQHSDLQNVIDSILAMTHRTLYRLTLH